MDPESPLIKGADIKGSCALYHLGQFLPTFGFCGSVAGHVLIGLATCVPILVYVEHTWAELLLNYRQG